MKKLYQFQVWNEQEVEEVKIDKNDKNEEVKTLVKTKKYIPHKFYIRKPTRNLHDDADLFYGVELSQAVKEGLLTKAQLSTKFADEIGTISQNDKKRYIESYANLLNKEAEYQTKSLKKTEEQTDKDKEEIKAIALEIAELRRDLQEIEMSQQSLFDHAAETRARNKTILWWVLNLTYHDDGRPVFGEGDFKTRLSKYDEFEEKDDIFMLSLSRKVLYLISFLFTSKADTEEEIDKVAKSVGLNIDPNSIDKENESV